MWQNWYGSKIIKAIEVWMEHGFVAALYTHFIIMLAFWWLLILLLVIASTAVLTLHERKVIADIQTRRGPAKVGYFGILQPIADAFKLLLKEYIVPFRSEGKMYISIAVVSFIMAALFWNLPAISLYNVALLTETTILYSFLFSIIHVFTILFAGWSSNSRYSFLGAIRASAQLIAYDIVIILIYVHLFFFGKELSYEAFVELQHHIKIMTFFFMPLQTILFFIGLVCETSRHPFDFPEAESELVSGYNVEYSGIRFALFFLGEYATVIYSALLVTIMFFTGSMIADGRIVELIEWVLKAYIFIWFVIHARALLPRYRYDQLMETCWKVMIPLQCLSLGWTILIVYYF